MSRLKNIDDSNIRYGLYAKFIKRPLDFCISLTALLLLSPFLLVLCLLVRIKLGSPIFFKQTRCGQDEIPFEMIKFRTMTDARDENGNLFPDTDRFTKFGDFLRNYSLDELPELLNVLKGDMSLIGPRPLYTFYVPYYTEEEALRHVVRGGITGLAQINGRALCRWKERFAYDVKYVKNISFINDVKILWNTVYKVFKKSDIGVPSVTDEGGLHIIRDVQRLDRVKEIGSSFSVNDNGKECENYPTFITRGVGMDNYSIYLSTGRSCIREILSKIKAENKRAIIPAFTCESVIEPFLDSGYEIRPYSLNENLTINTTHLKQLIADFKPGVLLFHRYFGFDTCHDLENLISKTGIVTIEDETQFMFSTHRESWADYKIGSIRKWGAIPDGAYLISKQKEFNQPTEFDEKFINLEKAAMSAKQNFLDKKNSDSCYQSMFAEGRMYIDAQKKTFSISKSSNAALETLDIASFIEKRRLNAKILIEGLQNSALLNCVFKRLPEGTTPFMIPVLVKKGRKELQNYLSSQKIFSTIIWGCPNTIKGLIGITDKRIYDEILCIPCDQRYNQDDMSRIVNTIKLYEKNGGKNG